MLSYFGFVGVLLLLLIGDSVYLLLRASTPGSDLERILILACIPNRPSKLLYLALEQFQAGASSSTNVAELVLSTVVSNDRCSVATADDDGSRRSARPVRTRRAWTWSHSRTRGTRTRRGDRSRGWFSRRGWSPCRARGTWVRRVEAHPVGWDALLVRREPGLRVLVEVVGGDVVDWEDDFNAGLCCALQEGRHFARAVFVEEGLADLCR